MVSPQQVPEYYQLGNLFVSASTSETQGLTYIEALASGLPALCRQDPCLTGVIRDGVNGWQFRDGAEFRTASSAMRSCAKNCPKTQRKLPGRSFPPRPLPPG